MEQRRLSDEERDRLFEALDRSWAAFANEPEDQIEAGVAEAIAQARAELRQEREARAKAG